MSIVAAAISRDRDRKPCHHDGAIAIPLQPASYLPDCYTSLVAVGVGGQQPSIVLYDNEVASSSSSTIGAPAPADAAGRLRGGEVGVSAPQHTCCAKVHHPDGWLGRYALCTRRGKVERDGKWYCAQHDPVARDKARIERNARWEEERKKRQLADAAPDLYAALHDLVVEWSDDLDDPFWNAARAALARARGETP